jgi:hypothetical protein
MNDNSSSTISYRDFRVFALLGVLLFFLFLSLGANVLQTSSLEATPTPESALVSPTVTPLPPEYLDNYAQTTGIILATAVIVLIVVGSVLYGLLSNKKR